MSDLARILADIPDENLDAEIDKIVDQLGDEGSVDEVLFDFFGLWAREDQKIPDGDWNVWMIRSGRGAGKTRVGSEWTNRQAKNFPGCHIALVGQTVSDVRDVMVKGDGGGSSIIETAPPWFMPTYVPSRRKVIWPNGSQATTYSGDKPDQLRGPQHHFCFDGNTLIDTPLGRVPIRSIQPGDTVSTRHGERTVGAVIEREAEVGRWGDTSCTPDHVVLSPNGWQRVSECDSIISWDNGKKTREGIATGTWTGVSSGSTAGYGNKSTVRSLRDGTYTIETVTPPTTTYQISNAYRQAITLLTMGGQIAERLLAKIVARASFATSLVAPETFARIVNGSAVTPSGLIVPPSAFNAEPSFGPGRHGSVPSGVQTVFDLEIDGEHEYIASGMVVHNSWVDELAKFEKPTQTWDQLELGMRLGVHPRTLVTTTPRPIHIIKQLDKDPTTHVTVVSTFANRANLAGPYLDRITRRYQNTTLGRQELEGSILDDMAGALWSRASLEATRVYALPSLEIVKVVVGVDPAMTGDEGSNETGIIVGCRTIDDHYYVLEDRSGRYSPEAWARQVALLAHEYSAQVVGEVNQGGDLVESVIRQADRNLKLLPGNQYSRIMQVKQVRATRGKRMRAEPVAALWEQGRAHIVGVLPDLEDQLVNFTGLEEEEVPKDRLDAVVWCLTELSTFHEIRVL